jgi:DNA end-binding protein Ku
MFFHDEVRPVDEIAPGKVKVPKAELELATALIERFTGSFEPRRYEDTYREALCDVIRAKRKGKTVTAPEPESEGEPADLMAALRASVEAAKSSRRSSTAKTSRKASSPARKPGSRRKKKSAAKKR